MSNQFDFRAAAKQVLDIEVAALQELDTYFDDQFEKACELILSNNGKVVVMGIGKSGHIGNKIAATLASTGTSAFFRSSSEAAHGDLGMISLVTLCWQFLTLVNQTKFCLYFQY